VGFSQRKPHEKCHVIQSFPYRFFHTCTWFTVETVTYIHRFVEGNHVHLEKHAVLVRTIGQTLPGLSAVVFLSVGHYPCYREP
jgi:hypothetical protein